MEQANEKKCAATEASTDEFQKVRLVPSCHQARSFVGHSVRQGSCLCKTAEANVAVLSCYLNHRKPEHEHFGIFFKTRKYKNLEKIKLISKF